jgi:putative flippase GtrA
LAGASGFVVDAGVLTALVHWGGWGPFASRLVSFPIALTVTWLLNRALAFRGRRSSPILSEYVGYAAIQVTGAATNLAVFSACLLLNERLREIPLVPLAIGAIFGLAVNFTLLNWGLYRSR